MRIVQASRLEQPSPFESRQPLRWSGQAHTWNHRSPRKHAPADLVVTTMSRWALDRTCPHRAARGQDIGHAVTANGPAEAQDLLGQVKGVAAARFEYPSGG